jgi:alpha-mannosidase
MRRLHLLCNAHLDPCWLWEWEEGAAEALSTFRTAADLCEANDTFVFNHNEVTLYRWIEAYEPELFERIQRLVQAGRWHIMGGWYLQPDCNLPSGESFVRQILIGRLYFQEKFGAWPTTAINFDPFGHSRGLVQILKKSGYDSYLFGRPTEGFIDLPESDFIWVGLDGSEVAAHRFIGWYNASLGKARAKVEQWLKDNADCEVGLVLWGVGNHGGGPSRKDIADLNALIAETAEPPIIHSTPEAFFAELAACGLPATRREADLNPWAPGCYTSQVRLKQKHRLLENELFMVEKMAATLAIQGRKPYPREAIREALYDLLAGEFHDILPGSSIQPVEEAGIRLFDHGLEILSRLKAEAFFALAEGQPKTPDGQVSILAYNPHPFPVEGVFECEFNLPDANFEEQFTMPVVCRDGKPIPCQVEKEISNQPVDWRKRSVFRAELAPGQVNRFTCNLKRVLKKRPAPKLRPKDGLFVLSTESMCAVIDAKSGLMTRYEVNGVNYLAGDGILPRVMVDDEDSWSTGSVRYREVEGCFNVLSRKAAMCLSGLKEKAIAPVRVIEDGEVRTVIEALFGYGDSFLVLTYSLPKQGSEIELHARVFWGEKSRMLKLAVTTPFRDGRYLGQTAYGWEEMPGADREVAAQKWTAAVSPDGQQALTCINEGSYGSDFVDGEMRLTLLRSPAYSSSPFGERPVVRPDGFTPRIDQGERQFRFWLNAGPYSARIEAVDREALVKNEKPFLLSFNPSGMGAPPLPGVLLHDGVVQLTAFKQAERSKDFVMRLFEPTGQARTTTVELPALGLRQEIAFGPFEIKSFLVDPEAKNLTEIDLVERPL